MRATSRLTSHDFGIEHQGRTNLPLRLFGSSFLLEVPRLGAMGFGKPGIDFERALGGGKRVLLPAMNESQVELGERHQRPGLRVIRVESASPGGRA